MYDICIEENSKFGCDFSLEKALTALRFEHFPASWVTRRAWLENEPLKNRKAMIEEQSKLYFLYPQASWDDVCIKSRREAVLTDEDKSAKDWCVCIWVDKPMAFDFSWALTQLKRGKRVARSGWNGKDMFLYLVAGSTFKVDRPPLLGIYKEGTEISYHAHIDMKTAQGDCVPWLASQTDILANDWEYV